jgi:UDP-3-O-[3-hydroxymyristoyl] glucosamine N-acyltransferase
MPVLKEIIARLKPVEFYGNAETVIGRVVELNEKNIQQGDILWCSDKNIAALSTIQAGTILLSPAGFENIKATHPAFKNINWLIFAVPRRAFMEVLQAFFVRKREAGISPKASIHSSVIIPANCTIGHGVVIEEGCMIGNDVSIGHNTVLMTGTIVEDGVTIGSNCTIGGVGFGYEQSESGQYELIPHIGNVRICKGSEIGNNTAIDRGVIGTTLIGENVKIDNLVHIAHGVKIGSNSLVIAHAMIAGSAELGKNVWISPCASVLQKVKVGDNSIVGMGSVVLKDVPENKVAVGTPAKIIRDNK